MTIVHTARNSFWNLILGLQHLSTEVEQPTTAQHSLEQPSSPQPNATEKVGILYMYSH